MICFASCDQALEEEEANRESERTRTKSLMMSEGVAQVDEMMLVEDDDEEEDDEEERDEEEEEAFAMAEEGRSTAL